LRSDCRLPFLLRFLFLIRLRRFIAHDAPTSVRGAPVSKGGAGVAPSGFRRWPGTESWGGVGDRMRNWGRNSLSTTGNPLLVRRDCVVPGLNVLAVASESLLLRS
jgi:hypothetical protein